MARSVRSRILALLAAVLLAAVAVGFVFLLRWRDDPGVEATDYAARALAFGGRMDVAALPYAGVETSSFYLPMRDGVRLAVDLHLPRGLPHGARVPALIVSTRYWRAADIRFPFSLLVRPSRFVRFFTRNGYAIVRVDARGSGASFGTRPMPWSPDEREDAREICDWIVGQPWSNGAVGATGVSYSGTAAEFAAMLDHPALKAAAPQFCLYDVYDDIALPGGVLNSWFVDRWSQANTVLDAGRLPEAMGWLAHMAVRGPRPVDGPEGRALVAQAVAGHEANLDIAAAAREITFRDDVTASGVAAGDFSPHTFADRLARSRTALSFWGGWFDGAYAESLLRRWQRLPPERRGRAILGAWNHGGVADISPYRPDDAPPEPSQAAQLLELARFFDHYLLGRGEAPASELRFAVLGEDEWRTTDAWPPAGTEPLPFFLGAGGTLAAGPPAEHGRDALDVDFVAGTGTLNRWRTQLTRADVVYPADLGRGCLTYVTPPLPRPLLLAGSPALRLTVDASRDDAAVHAYLQDVDVNGTRRTLSEGRLRLLHRAPAPGAAENTAHTYLRRDGLPVVPGEAMEAAFTLLPVAARIRAGHALRLAVCGADGDEFARLPEQGPLTLGLSYGPGRVARLELPVSGDAGH